MVICTMVPECLSKIFGQTWEELTAQVITESLPFLCLRHVVKPTVRFIKPT